LGEEEWYSEGLLVGQAAKATLERSLEAYERKQGLCRFARFRQLVVSVTSGTPDYSSTMEHSPHLVSCVQIPRRRYGTLCGSLLCPISSPIDFPFPPLQRSTTLQSVPSNAASGTSRLFRLSCKVLLHNTASRRLIRRHADNETDQPLDKV
jgi:hypothetical protein